MGCVFPIVISSELGMGQNRDDDHQEDAPHFTYARYTREDVVQESKTSFDSYSWTAVPPVRIGTERYVVRIFGTVRGTDFGTKFYLVRYVVRILVRIFVGTERGPEFGTKIRSGTDNSYRSEFCYKFSNEYTNNFDWPRC